MNCFENYFTAFARMYFSYFGIVFYLTLGALCLTDVPSNEVEEAVCLNASGENLMVHDEVWRTTSGRPLGDVWNSLTVGPRGPLLLQDSQYIEATAEFNRRATLRRVVHSKGNGAFGYFEVTNDVTGYTKAKVFSRIGKKTPIAARFSLGVSLPGTADTVREIRGFAVKFYTEEGNWDLVGLNIPIFAARDPMVTVTLGKFLETGPVTGTRINVETLWRLLSIAPEAIGAVIFVFTSRGIPLSYRHIDGFGINTFKLVNDKGENFFCRFNYLTDQGIRNMTKKEAEKWAAKDPFHHGRDLYQAIKSRNFPSWTLSIQVMTSKQATEVSFNPFDATKEWPQADFPMIPVGRIVLNRNPTDFPAEVEQIALCPANLVPGIELSPDKILQGRILAYPDALRHRLGSNFHRIPINAPLQLPAKNEKERNIRQPTNFLRSFQDPDALESPYDVCGTVQRYDTSNDDNFSQARIYYKSLDKIEKRNLVENIIEGLQMATEKIPDQIFDYFTQVDAELGRRILEGFEKLDSEEGRPAPQQNWK